MEFYISSAVSAEGRDYNMILAKANLQMESMKLIGKIDTTQNLIAEAPELRLESAKPAQIEQSQVITAELAPIAEVVEEDDYPF